jgi:hypothetical protein
MAGLSKLSAFPPSGPSCWPLGGDPVWRGGHCVDRGGWWHAKAAFALDFLGGRAMRGGVEQSPASVLSTTRSSPHLLADNADRFQTFDANVLACISGVGAYIGEQRTNKYAGHNAAPPTAVTPTTAAAFNVAVPSLVASGDAAALFGVVDDSAGMTGILASLRASGKCNGLVYVIDNRAGSADSQISASQSGGGSTGNTLSHISSAIMRGGTGYVGLTTSTGRLTVPASAVYARRISNPITPTNNDRTHRVTANAGQIVYFILPQLEQGGFVTPPIVTEGVAATRYASDVRASSFGWFDAAGLASGGSVLVVPNWSHAGDGISRPLFEFSDGTDANLVRGYVDASGKPALQIVAGGVTQATATLGVSIALGRKPLAFGWSATGGYVADKAGNSATFGAVTLPVGLNQKRIGGSVAANFLNDTLEELQACVPLTQAEALAWVVSA